MTIREFKPKRFLYVIFLALVISAWGWIGWRGWLWKTHLEVQRWVESYGGTVNYGEIVLSEAMGSPKRTPQALAQWTGHPVLDDITSVVFSGSPGFAAEEFTRFSGLPSLVRLVVSCSTFDDSHLEVVAKAGREIQILSLLDTGISSSGLEHLGKMKNLTTLEIDNFRLERGAPPSEELVRVASALPFLEVLMIEEGILSPAQIKALEAQVILVVEVPPD